MLHKQIKDYENEKMVLKSCLNCKEQYSSIINTEVNHLKILILTNSK